MGAVCHLCRACEQQRSCSLGLRRKELHATEGAVAFCRARCSRGKPPPTSALDRSLPRQRRAHIADGAGRVPVLAATRGTVCGEVGRVPGFPELMVLSPYGALARAGAPLAAGAARTPHCGARCAECMAEWRHECVCCTAKYIVHQEPRANTTRFRGATRWARATDTDKRHKAQAGCCVLGGPVRSSAKTPRHARN